MVDEAKAKAAKDKFEAAKKAAEDAVVADESVTEAEAKLDAAEDVEPNAADARLTDDDAEKLGEDRDDKNDVDKSGDDKNGGEKSVDPIEAEAGDAADTLVGGQAADAEPQEDHLEDHEEESAGFAATALRVLLVFLAGVAVTLWAAPRLAPVVPAPIAAYLSPQQDIGAEIEARLNERLDGYAAEANVRISDASKKADEAISAAAAVSTRVDGVEAKAAEGGEEPAPMDAAMAQRLAAAEASLKGLRAEIDGLGGVVEDGAAPSAAVLERVVAFGAAVEGLRREVDALSAIATQAETAAQAADVAALADRVGALEAGEAATSGARSDAAEIRRSAEAAAGLARIEQALLSGAPFGDALSTIVELAGGEAPEALSAVAVTGAPTQVTLSRSFGAAARDGYSAALQAQAGDGWADGVLASLEGRIGGRPSVETAGDDAGAVLSRIEARLREGRLIAAQAEAGALPEATTAAMGDWLSALNRAVAAENALSALAASFGSDG
ncbi:MAG: COG4223 family protein [Pikeienuella sp.]